MVLCFFLGWVGGVGGWGTEGHSQQNQVAKAYAPPDMSGPDRLEKKQQINMRHLHWLRRSATNGNVSWRPRKVYRAGAVKWMLCKDNMVRVGTRWCGLNAFSRKLDKDAWSMKNWRKWPHINAAQDQGSDGLCGVNCLKYRKSTKCNLTDWWDESHGIGNDTLDTWKKHHLYSFIMVTMIVMNLPFGPEKEPDMRFGQMVEALSFMVKHFNPDTLGSLQAHADTMSWELRRVLDRCHDRPIDNLWAYICQMAGFPKQGRRVNFARFMAWLRAAGWLLQHWTLLLWLLEHLVLEMDMVGTQKFKALAMKQHDVVEGFEGEQATTSSSVPTLESKALRSCCQNAAVVGVMVLSEYANRRLLACMYWAAQPFEQHHGMQNTQCRSVPENKKHVMHTLTGGLFRYLHKTWLQLQNRDVLIDCQLQTRDGHSILEVDADDPALAGEDEWAGTLGSFIHTLVANRVIRELYKFGYPQSFAVMLTDDMPKGYIGQLKDDWGIFKSLRDMRNRTAAEEEVFNRSQFQLTSVLQVVAALEEFNWRGSAPAVTALLDERFNLGHATQLVEDSFVCAKNSKQVRGSQKFRKPERSMGIIVGEEVGSKRHRHEMVEPAVALPSKTAKLSAASFGKVPVRTELDVKGVASGHAKADYFTCNAKNLGVPTSDLYMQRHCQTHANRHDLEYADLGCFVGPRSVVFMCDAPPLASGHDTFGWHVGCGHMRDSAAVAWPVELRPVPGHPADFYVDFTSVVQTWPTILPIVSWKHIKARSFVWRSPLFLSCVFTNSDYQWRQEVHAILRDDVVPLQVVAARQAWWELGVETLKTVASHLGIKVAPKATTWETLLAMTMKVLGVDEEHATAILASRVTRKTGDKSAVDELLQLDEASKLLSREDEADLEKQQAKQTKLAEQETEVYREYKEAKVRLREARKKQEARAAGSGKRAKAKAAPKRQRLPNPEVLDHARAKALTPPSSLIWRSFHGEAWCGRYKQTGSHSRTWRKAGGSNHALHQILVLIWQDYCKEEALDPKDCPMEGVYDLASAEGSHKP